MENNEIKKQEDEFFDKSSVFSKSYDSKIVNLKNNNPQYLKTPNSSLYYNIKRDYLGSYNKPYTTKKIVSLRELNDIKKQKISKNEDIKLRQNIAKIVYGKQKESGGL